MNPKSLRKRNSVIQKITSIHKNHLLSPDKDRIYSICDAYLDSVELGIEAEKSFYDMVHDNIIVNVSEYLQPKIAANTISVSAAEEVVFGQPFQEVQDRLWSLLDTWVLMYKGPVPTLADIAENSQNIHTTDVLKKTTDGVILLGKVEVPPGQKTLAEFEKEIRRLLTPVKYETSEEMFAYLASNLEIYKQYPDEFRHLLQDTYVAAQQNPIVHGRVERKPQKRQPILYYTNDTDADGDEQIEDNLERMRCSAEDEVEEDEEVEEVMQLGGKVDKEELEKKLKEMMKLWGWVEEVKEEELWGGVEKVESPIVANTSVLHMYTLDTKEPYGPVYRGDHTKMLQYFIDANNYSAECTSMLYKHYYHEYYSKYFYPIDSQIKETLEDMREWGNRPAVMKKGENVYKATLRGLWAKIKTYEPEVRDELIKRLYEECHEATGLCADGHVGRLCNVLVGFDSEFTSSLSPMEYFQNNIALISENIHATHESKVQQAIALMNDVGMPEGERQAWLDAF